MSGITTSITNGVLRTTSWVSGPTTLVIPASVTSILSTAFTGGTAKLKITSVTFNTNINLKTIPASLFSGCKALHTVSFPSNTSITSIGDNAFKDCTALTTITLPSGITNISAFLFIGCTSLVTVSFPLNSIITHIGNKAFQNCTALTTITLPSSVTTIDSHAFSGCTKLPSISIPTGVITISTSIFSGCTLLNTVIFQGTGVTSIGVTVFQSCPALANITLPSGVTSIGAAAFSGCYALTSINIPSGVSAISDTIFFNCSKLTSVTIPSGVTSIGINAFSGCTALKDITLLRKSPQTLATLSSNCFLNTGITTTEYGSALEMFNNGYTQAQLTTTAGIAAAVFSRVSTVSSFLNLSVSKTTIASCNPSFDPGNVTLFIPSSVTSIGANAFLNMPYTSFSGLKFIGNSITTIGSSAFQNCHNIQNATLPNSLISIGENAFRSCAYLVIISLQRTVEQGLTTLGLNCFFESGLQYDWSGVYNLGYKRSQLITAGLPISVIDITNPPLGIEITVDVNGVLTSASYDSGSTDLVIPSSVVAIGTDAFLNLSVLKSVIIPNTVISIGNTAFSGCSGLTSVTLQRTSAEGLTILGTDCFSGVAFTTTNYVSVTNMYSMGYTTDQLTTSGISISVLNKSVGDVFFVFSDSSKTTITGFNSTVSITGLTPEIPSSVTSIAANAFLNCTTLSSVTFSTNVISIGNNAFKGCSNLTTAAIPASVATIGTSIFQNCGFTSYNWPSTLPTINDYTFAGCIDLTSVIIQSGVTTIKTYVFNGCFALTSVSIPATVNAIGNNTFQMCGFIEFTWPNIITKINDYMFADCIYLQRLKIIPTVPQVKYTLGKFVFKNCPSLRF